MIQNTMYSPDRFLKYYDFMWMPMSKFAHAYVPFQHLFCIYTPMEGLVNGTIFPELNRPYGVDIEYTVDA